MRTLRCVCVCVCVAQQRATPPLSFCVACSCNHLADPEFLPVAPLLLRLLELVLAVGEAGFLVGGPGCGGGQITRSNADLRSQPLPLGGRKLELEGRWSRE